MTGENKAVTARFNRMKDALDLAIDWLANSPPGRSVEWGNVITEAGKTVGCSQAEIYSLIAESLRLYEAAFTYLGPEDKLNTLLILREKYAD